MATTTERPIADALTAIKTRRSVKEYVPTEIPREWIEELLRAPPTGRLTNHKLTHPWRFHVFSAEGRERLVGAPTGGGPFACWRKRVSRRARRLSASLERSVIRPQSSSSFPWWAMRTKSLTKRTSRPAGARFRTCWSPRPREACGSYPSTGAWIDQNFVGPVCSDSQRKSGRWRAFSWGTPSRRLWPSACPWSAIPPGTPRPESPKGLKSPFSLSGERLSPPPIAPAAIEGHGRAAVIELLGNIDIGRGYTMTRISILSPDDMNNEQRAVIDASKANGRPHGGPFWAYIRNPKLMQSVQNLGACIADSTLSAREQQIVTLTVARFWGANYPWAVQCRRTPLKLDSRRKKSSGRMPAARCRPMTSANCSRIR